MRRKKRGAKKFIGMILSGTLIASLLCSTAFYAGAAEVDEFTDVDNADVRVSYSDTCVDDQECVVSESDVAGMSITCQSSEIGCVDTIRNVRIAGGFFAVQGDFTQAY